MLLSTPSRNAGDSIVRAFPRGQFRVPLHDLGATDRRYAGVLIPEPEVDAEKVGITDQFLADAETYHSKYSHVDHFMRLFNLAFDDIRASIGPDPTILDIGSGSGFNTVIPLLRLFPDSRIVATDLSADLLRILRSYSIEKGLEDRIACVCTDAMNNHFEPSSFDVLTGASILHHLIEPMHALDAAHRTLKDGGFAVFFEPFEGWSLVGLAFKQILARAERAAARRARRVGWRGFAYRRLFGDAEGDDLALDPAVADFLRRMCIDYDARKGRDKSAPHFRCMDDKWLFTRSYFEDKAAEAGFSSVRFIPQSAGEPFFRGYTASLIRLGTGRGPDALPDWAWTHIDMLDSEFTFDMKADVLIEGIIVLRKEG